MDENAPEYVHEMFASLVPGFHNIASLPTRASGSIFHDTNAQHPISPSELLPVLPPSGGEKPVEQTSKIFLEAVLEYMVTTVVRLEWQDKASHHHRCFHFLLEMFKRFYLPKICPGYCHETSLYEPDLSEHLKKYYLNVYLIALFVALPVLRKPEQETEFVSCRVTLIKWVANYMHVAQKKNDGNAHPSTPQPQQNHEDSSDHEITHASLDSSKLNLPFISVRLLQAFRLKTQNRQNCYHVGFAFVFQTNLILFFPPATSIQTLKTPTEEDLAARIVRDVLCGSRDNVDFVHEIYRQSFLLNFTHAVAVRKTIAVYKDLIQMNVPELPIYMLEPSEDCTRPADERESGFRPARLRNDSYLGAIQKENLLVRAGSQNLYRVFVTHAANVFMLEVGTQVPGLLEEQTDACKRVLNIYRYMVMHTRMDSNTW